MLTEVIFTSDTLGKGIAIIATTNLDETAWLPNVSILRLLSMLKRCVRTATAWSDTGGIILIGVIKTVPSFKK